jgi:predicted metal-dependent hydrolase
MQGVFTYAGQELPYNARFSARKTLSISVLPDRSIDVVAPSGTAQSVIEERLKGRARWILRQRRLFEQFMPRTPERRYVGGETHLYLGRQYRLKLVEGAEECVKLKGAFLNVTTLNRRDAGHVKELVDAWYRRKAEARLRARFDIMLAKFEAIKLGEFTLRLRAMKLRWGSHSRKGIITLNPELIRAPSNCIDYVIAHELAHTVESNHSERFYELLDRIMHDRSTRKELLERLLS